MTNCAISRHTPTPSKALPHLWHPRKQTWPHNDPAGCISLSSSTNGVVPSDNYGWSRVFMYDNASIRRARLRQRPAQVVWIFWTVDHIHQTSTSSGICATHCSSLYTDSRAFARSSAEGGGEQ